jgi:NTE family protein
MRKRKSQTSTAVQVYMPALPKPKPRIGLALGGGGARGLSHVLMLEALDELGVKPSIISGTSIGAIYGAAYASGLNAKEIRAYTSEILSQRLDLVREVFSARVKGGVFTQVLNLFGARTALLDPVVLLDLIMPSRFAESFDKLTIPLKIVATDFYAQESRVFTSGPLKPAVAASMALPVLFAPVVVDGRALIDGGLVNPLPFDIVAGEADITVAIDVTGAPVPVPGRDTPTATEALFSSAFIWERSLIREKLLTRQPDILIESGTRHFSVLDFLRYEEILKAAEPAKAELKQHLARVLAAETIEPVTIEVDVPVAVKTKKRLTRLTRRR